MSSPAGVSSGVRGSAFPSPSQVEAQLTCRLPVVTFGTFDPRAVAEGAGAQGANLGFFKLPNGPAVNDASDLIGWDSIRFRTQTFRQPILQSGGQIATGSWDAVASRWVPVESGLVSPDGAAYAWTEDPSASDRTSRIHVTTVSTGHDIVVLDSGSGTPNGLGYGVVRYDSNALLLTQIAASEGGIHDANLGLWRFDLRSLQLSQVAPPTTQWSLLSPNALWINDVDLAGGPPMAAPSPGVGVMTNRVIRLDLQTRAPVTWISRPGMAVALLGVDLNDRPLLRTQTADSTEVDYSTSPDQATTVYRLALGPVYGPSNGLNATGVGYAPHQEVVDSHGIWLTQFAGQEPKLVLVNPSRGLQEMPRLGLIDSVHTWNAAGPCID
jgi:hypothetical protein